MSFSFKRPLFNSAATYDTQENKQVTVKEEDWGDDDDDEIMEKFVMAATQAEKAAEAPSSSQLSFGNKSNNNPRYGPGAWSSSRARDENQSQQLPNTVRSFHFESRQKLNQVNGTTDDRNLRDSLRQKEEELAQLREQINQKNLLLVEIKEDLTKQSLGQKRHYEQALLAKENELNVTKTKLKFKEIDVQTLEQRCRKLELSNELGNAEHSIQKPRKRLSGFDYLERDAFDPTKKSKIITAVAAVQTSAVSRIRRGKRKPTALTHVGVVSTDSACEERQLLRNLKSLTLKLKTFNVESKDYSSVQESLNIVRISNMSKETISAFCAVCMSVLHAASKATERADFLSCVIEPYLVRNARYLSSAPGDLTQIAFNLCRCVDFQFERRLPNLLVLSAALLTAKHTPQNCVFLLILNTRKKESLIKTLLDSYTEALKYILNCDQVACGCYEEFAKQLYYSIEDNYSNYKKLLSQHVSFAPTGVLVQDSVFLYSDHPSKAVALQKEWSEKTNKLVPLFRRAVLNTGLVADYNTKMWLLSALQSVQLFKNVLNDDNEEVSLLLGHLGNGDLQLSVLERRILEQTVTIKF